MKFVKSPDQLAMLYQCSGCYSLVTYSRALAYDPTADPFNCVLHPKCGEATHRWFRYYDDDGELITRPRVQVVVPDGTDNIHHIIRQAAAQ